MFLMHRRQHRGASRMCRFDNDIWMVNDKQESSGRSVNGSGGESPHVFASCRHPEARVADGELRDDVIPLANEVHDLCAKGALVERNSFSSAINPQLGLNAVHENKVYHSRLGCRVLTNPHVLELVKSVKRGAHSSCAECAR